MAGKAMVVCGCGAVLAAAFASRGRCAGCAGAEAVALREAEAARYRKRQAFKRGDGEVRACTRRGEEGRSALKGGILEEMAAPLEARECWFCGAMADPKGFVGEECGGCVARSRAAARLRVRARRGARERGRV